MKKLFWALSVAAILTSCEQECVETPSGTSTKQVTFALTSGNTAATRATPEETGITDLWLLDYVGDELSNTIHKSDDFGAITLSMPYGKHTICVVASRGTDPVLNAPVISWSKPSDTFWASLDIDVQPGSNDVYTVTLKRCATRLRINVTDEIPASAATIEVEPATWYYGIDVRTGEGCDAKKQGRQISIPASYIGTSGKLTASFFGLSPKEEWTTDIAVRMYASEGVMLGEVTLTDASFSMNSTTLYSGGILSTASPFLINIDDVWGDENENTW